ncbi:hypothetical protein CHGG_06470 [Chaetomium globosum CBS 148.51]|uniref:MADS-box domain-containing protein n=1 Tax=Chaetomium globosum (strain ATCC 6205 / CBS 148.51 / DSM 1962 / NBRC 6347 / NRRL 1970) TaxID=306901 RepID=Q2H4E5_CHAGB|nr:uncharacterized protein CHGG_06470 [Chaetomium globosum CBS 148.51]EAQ89851.1 hypothetical protein CHGG_06470 [Chaetomium globosum CBS 148.51]
MADITDQHDQTSPTELEDAHTVGNGNNNVGETRGIKRARPSTADDDDDDDEKGGRERRKIEIKFIGDKSRRHITFSKRKAGIMKKAYELSVLTGTQVLLLVVSETGLVYTFTTPKLQPLVTKAEGKNLIQACLNAPEPPAGDNGLARHIRHLPDRELIFVHMSLQRTTASQSHMLLAGKNEVGAWFWRLETKESNSLALAWGS